MAFFRHWIGLACLAGLASGLLAVDASSARPEQTPNKNYWVYIGTYTGGKSKGIYRFELDTATGKLSGGALAAEIVSPSFLAIHPNQKFLYAVNEVSGKDKKKGGGVTAFAVDAKTGALKLLNQQSSGGPGPCHLTIDRAGKHVLIANYNGGSAIVLPIQPDGRLGEATAFVQHQGKGTNPKRQEGPHAHSVNVDAGNRFAVVADLGLDQLLVYRFDADKGTLTPNDPPHVAMAPGAGPRHFAFHPTAPYGYAINELDSTITAMSWDGKKGEFTKLQTVSTLPKDFKGNTTTAEVVVHQSGRFVYGSNRGHDSIVAFAVDPQKGTLTYVGHQGKDIKTPRNFAIDPTGQYLIVGNQGSDSLVVFRINQGTGELTHTGQVVETPRPVCIRFLPKG
jgi:6-phosphogluconolactonase